MKYWLRGKRGGLMAFVVIAGLIGGGLGWVTLEALQLEKEQLASHIKADISLALWRLDSLAFTELAKEANPSFQKFTIVPVIPPENNSTVEAQLELFELLPLEEMEFPPWIGRHYLLTRKSDWKSPQTLQTYWTQGYGIKNHNVNTTGFTSQNRLFLAELTKDTQLEKLLFPMSDPVANAPPVPGGITPQAALQSNTINSFPNNNDKSPQQSISRDATLRMNRAQVEQGQSALNNSGRNAEPIRIPAPNQPVTIVGNQVPLWMKVGDDQKLAVTRLVQVGDKSACQVTLADWPELQKLLADEVRDLVPNLQLLPITNPDSINLERAMKTLPVELDPGATASSLVAIGWNPLRIGLVLAWTAAGVGLLAMGLGGWSLINLSQRRIRFVSAVTHELRTPLTTLRLYLDMLATGLVTEEAQKADYIRTLNSEADRLNRLVNNVLDFSRLENQRPRLHRSIVPIRELLDQLQTNWQSHAKNSGKELVVDNTLEPETKLHTDVQLVTQILGNLIDNACKYSQGTTDPRIWIRARREGNQKLVLEVEDPGPGVPHRERRSIFQPFRRGRHDHDTTGGVGLGLALANRWAHLLGGKLSFHSLRESTGACFRLELPI